ncbi:MAG: DUF4091 domain-containing protein, partial [Clostridia bacterium]|nr:DUF4091 domain-containing protein [Clostridia bacterium]
AAQDPTVPCYGFNTNGKVYSSFTTKDGETIQNFIGLDLDKLETYWKTFIDESVKYEIDVFKKAYVYMGSIIDEPDAWGDAAIKRVDIVCDQYNDHKQKMAEYANSQRTSENSEFIDGLMDSILNVTHVVTTWNSGRYQLVDAFCPEPQFYESLAVIEDYQDHRANGGDYWWYTCVNPKPPYPSIHIDANGVNSRMMYWMMREYDISGYLSWESLVFYDDFPASEGHYLRGMEAYDDVMRHDGDIGDAYYFYPGKVLGLDRPVPSIRLYYMRDGGEDYDAITDLEEKLYPALSQRYGKPLSADGVLNELYGEMYALNKIYSSSIELQHGKEVLNALMVWAANGIAVSDYTVNGDGTVSANIYAPNDATIAVNGATLTGTACGDGKVYQIANVKADAFELEINGRKIILNSKTNVENAKEAAFGFEDAMQAPMEGVTVEKGVIDGKDVCSFTVDENIQNVLYALDENFITAANNSVVLYLYADIPEKMKVSVDISGKVTRTLGTIYLHPGYNALRFDRTSELDWKKIGKANLLILSFKKDESVSDFKIHFQSIVTVG